MPIRPDLLASIQSALSSTITPNLTTASKGDDIYEAYAWSVVLAAARDQGANITFKDVHGNAVGSSFYFRTSPCEIWWNAHPYCHAELSFIGCPTLEAHVGIYVAGRSMVRHECDVAVLYKVEADLCRAKRVLPRAGKVVLAVECKYYVNSTPGLGLGRAFLGLRDEIKRDNRFFVATSASPSVEKLLSKHTKDYRLRFSPVTPYDVGVMRSLFDQVFATFKAQKM
jgi:hypothetical protein